MSNFSINAIDGFITLSAANGQVSLDGGNFFIQKFGWIL